jgi:hypothetical protein
MPKVYDSLGVPDGTTDYFLEMGERSGGRKVDLPVERLPFEILGQVQRFL